MEAGSGHPAFSSHVSAPGHPAGERQPSRAPGPLFRHPGTIYPPGGSIWYTDIRIALDVIGFPGVRGSIFIEEVLKS